MWVDRTPSSSASDTTPATDRTATPFRPSPGEAWSTAHAEIQRCGVVFSRDNEHGSGTPGDTERVYKEIP